MSAIIFLVFIAVFIFLLFGLFRIAEGRGQAEQRRSATRSRRSASRRQHMRSRRSSAAMPNEMPQPKKPALKAMLRAGYDVGEEFVRVTDIGLLEYRATKRPRLLRDEQARADSDYLRPFAELWLPYRSRGMVRFELVEIINGRPHLHYADEDEYDLDAGINALLPGTWLPLQSKDIDYDDQWRLRVLVGQTMLADHAFGWREAIGGSDIQRHIASDGEISAALQQAISAQQNEAVSLDDLLAE
jgi:hypothetical protein